MPDVSESLRPAPRETTPVSSGPLAVILWAAYLACSWTWCIGMFLPTLLIRDFGVWGFVVFAIPNIVGAAAMGWILKDGWAERLRELHAPAIGVFSAVTILFQIVFLFTYAISASMDPIVRVGIVIATIIVSRFLASGLLVWLISAGCLTLFLLDPAHPPLPASSTQTLSNAPGLLALAPVCVFGFLLCPYLDATFLRARANLSARSAGGAFMLGFAGLFAVMILFTLAYWSIASQTLPTAALSMLFGVHVLMQLLYTINVHFVAVQDEPPAPGPAFRATMIVLGIAALIVLVLGVPSIAGIEGREVLYRCFMSFYGLYFPAYVYLCVIPTGARGSIQRHSGVAGRFGRVKLVTLAIACSLATPCYWLGFVERRTLWLLPGLWIVLVSRLVVTRWNAGAQRGQLNSEITE